MKFIIGKKIQMTQRYRSDGSAVPVTKVVVGPCVVTQVKSVDQDGYTSVQLGFGRRRKVAKSVTGHLRGKGPFAVLREFRVTPKEAGKVTAGDQLTVGSFVPGDMVKVTGTSKGHGFQGVVKRHRFKGQPQTHGHKDQARAPGSSGPGGWQHVRRGKRMPGRMGVDQISIKNLEVVSVDVEERPLYLKGAVPGCRNGILLISGPGEAVVEKTVAKTVAAAPAEKSVESAPASSQK